MGELRGRLLRSQLGGSLLVHIVHTAAGWPLSPPTSCKGGLFGSCTSSYSRVASSRVVFAVVSVVSVILSSATDVDSSTAAAIVIVSDGPESKNGIQFDRPAATTAAVAANTCKLPQPRKLCHRHCCVEYVERVLQLLQLSSDFSFSSLALLCALPRHAQPELQRLPRSKNHWSSCTRPNGSLPWQVRSCRRWP